MDLNKQCDIAKSMTESNATNEIICKQVINTPQIVKQESCQIIDTLLKKHNLPFDKGFGIMKDDFKNIANKYNIDPASLFWIYMEWLKSE
ncbi:hypothetical protein [Hydrogenoanaerobacterium sp.]|uniref:hypothetical protein n=1 Tax=Hydrogenoanaerobacterium sp. TaxID=2953763 RepID=UPI002899D920|nr:hypothetical protein [Hydrogenoanaerobacterium sp.]